MTLRSFAAAAPEWEAHERAEAVMRGGGVRIDHVAGDRAFYGRRSNTSCSRSGASSRHSRPNPHPRCTGPRGPGAAEPVIADGPLTRTSLGAGR